MKALLLALSLVSASAFGAGEFTTYSKVIFQSASTYVPSNKVCTAGGYIYHKTKAAISFEQCSGGSNDRANCVIVTRPLVQPMQSTAQRCAQFTGHDDKNCARWETYALNQGVTGKMLSYSSRKSFEDGDAAAKVTAFAIPACGQTPVVPAN